MLLNKAHSGTNYSYSPANKRVTAVSIASLSAVNGLLHSNEHHSSARPPFDGVTVEVTLIQVKTESSMAPKDRYGRRLGAYGNISI